MIRRAYPPGMKKKRRSRGLSEYGEELREKQRLKKWYNLGERQFKNYVKEILAKRKSGEDAADALIKKLECRLDNVVFRLGFAQSRYQARQLVSHGHFLVNSKKVNIPSYQVKKGDKIAILPQKRQKKGLIIISAMLKKYQPPSWLVLNIDKMEGEVKEYPTIQEVIPPAEASTIFSYYSR